MNAALNFVSRPSPSARPSSPHQPRSGRLAETDQRVQRNGPRELIEHHGLEQIRRAKEERTGQHAKRGESLRPATPAQLASDERGQHEHSGARERRNQADREQRITERRADALGKEGDGGREVHVPEPQVAAHGQVEQLVPVKAVWRDGVDQRGAGRV